MTTYKYITDTGTIVADTTTLLTDVQTEFQAALGESINLSASTPQGALITAEVLARSNVMRNNAELANMINPDLAYGVFLDAICSLLGITRGSDQSTVGTSITITGDYLTSIPDGSRVSTSNNDIFVTVGTTIIPISGIATATIKSQAFGPISLPVGPLTIMDGTIGWGSAAVNGGSSVVIGALALGDSQLKNLRKQQLAMQGIGSSAAIRAAALAVPNVTSVTVVENNTGAAGVVNGVTFSMPSAMWVCVAGSPDQAAVSQALYNAHSAGCPWDYGAAGNGTSVGSPNGVQVTDPATGLLYRVKWTTPIMYDCYVNISVQQSTSVSAPVQSVQNAIMNYATGQVQGEQGFVVGANVSAFEVAGTVARQLPGLYVKNCAIACVPKGSSAPVYPAGFVSEFLMSQFWQAELTINDITVNIV
jgi:hypothetical protein